MRPQKINTPFFFMAFFALCSSVVGTSQQAVLAQGKGANTAAGAIILQNNRTQHELRETKQELEQIREGLGLPAPESNTEDSPFVLLLACVATLGIIAFGLFWARGVLSGKDMAGELRHISRGQIEDARKAWIKNRFNPFFVFRLAPLIPGIAMCGLDMGSEPKTRITYIGFGLQAVSMLVLIAGLVVSQRGSSRKAYRKRYEELRRAL